MRLLTSTETQSIVHALVRQAFREAEIAIGLGTSNEVSLQYLELSDAINRGHLALVAKDEPAPVNLEVILGPI